MPNETSNYANKSNNAVGEILVTRIDYAVDLDNNRFKSSLSLISLAFISFVSPHEILCVGSMTP